MSAELVLSPQTELAARFLPVFDTPTALQRYQGFKEFVEKVLDDGVDFGLVPGSDKKTLLKPGAEKLCTLFGLVARYQVEEQIEDWRGQQFGEPLFYYKIKCQLWRGDNIMGEGFGSCSSWEAKYRYRWVSEEAVKRSGLDAAKLQTRGGRISEFNFAIDKAESTGPYGKPSEYWNKWKQAIESGKAQKTFKQTKAGKEMDAWEMDSTVYRVPNTDFADTINTVLKIAKKRSLVDATLGTTNASDYFTQDVEDYIDTDVVELKPEPVKPQADKHVDTGGHPINTQAAANYVRDQKLAAIAKEQATLLSEAEEKNVKLRAEIACRDEELAKQAQIKPKTEPSADPLWDMINQRISSGSRQDKMQQFEVFRQELSKHKTPEEVQQLFVDALARVGLQSLDDIRLVSQGRKVAKELYTAIQALSEQVVTA